MREFFIALIASSIIGFTLFYVFPAQGWFERYGIQPRPDQQQYLDMIKAVWTSESFAIDFRYSAGLVYFPSFHTILPILGLFAVRAIQLLFWVAAPLTVLIVCSTVTTGSHYPCDIYAGVLVAFLSQSIAKRLA